MEIHVSVLFLNYLIIQAASIQDALKTNSASIKANIFRIIVDEMKPKECFSNANVKVFVTYLNLLRAISIKSLQLPLVKK